jgi:hypothetical protein
VGDSGTNVYKQTIRTGRKYQILIRPKPKLANLRWGNRKHAHGDTGEMFADVENAPDGTEIQFLVERWVAGTKSWKVVDKVTATVSDGSASAQTTMTHPTHTGEETSSGDSSVRFRCKVQN